MRWSVQRVTLAWTGKKVSGLQNHVGELSMHGILFRAAPARLISRSIMFSDGVGVMAGVRRVRLPALDEAGRAATAGMRRHNDP